LKVKGINNLSDSNLQSDNTVLFFIAPFVNIHFGGVR